MHVDGWVELVERSWNVDQKVKNAAGSAHGKTFSPSGAARLMAIREFSYNAVLGQIF